jgi:hypothetical protein
MHEKINNLFLKNFASSQETSIKKLMEDLPAVPLFMMYYATPHNPKVTGLEDRSGFWGYYWWYIDKKE